ncbi:MAG: NAD(P)/FAD-dependent oxidoreductase [Negativicutes bacterium]|nr:NAD(P)/FAD-dependent oxidoreductase [Negativicutes bacterium]
MRQVEIAVVGAGPAGLSAAVEAAKLGAQVLVLDENYKPGGQLFKQIHKFFGSREHRAGVRGINLGSELLAEAARAGAEIRLSSTVYGIYADRRIGVVENEKNGVMIQARKIILATGASENALAFPGCTLPGVMSAGAVQTMVNLHRVLPAKRTLMIGSGNVGLIVAYQLLQAGGEVAALVEAAPAIGGYGVHAAKITRAGVPILTRHTVKQAWGRQQVEGATLVEVDDNFCPVPETEREVEAGCIAVAVGLNPLTELAQLCGCEFMYLPRLGGMLPVHNADMETSVAGIYVAGDIAGVEEASTAMEEGRLAGIAAAETLGYVAKEVAAELKLQVWSRMSTLRTGGFGRARQEAKTRIIEQGRGRDVN